MPEHAAAAAKEMWLRRFRRGYAGAVMSEGDPIVAEVVAELLARSALGKSKYGTTVAAAGLSHQQWLQHAFEEALDLAVYLRVALARGQGDDDTTAVQRQIADFRQQWSEQMSQVVDDINQLRTDLSNLTGAFAGYQGRVTEAVGALTANLATLQGTVTELQAAAVAASGTLPAELQSALADTHTAMQALTDQMTNLQVTAGTTPSPQS